MMKRITLTAVILVLCTYGLFSIEVGLIGGRVTNPSSNFYGLSGTMGFVIPMVKFEVELYKMSEVIFPGFENAAVAAVKFRPKFGKISPYAAAGFGAEFDTVSFDSEEYDSFTFVGGGVHYYITGMISVRGDIRFLNFSGFNRTRISAGVFFHF